MRKLVVIIAFMAVFCLASLVWSGTLSTERSKENQRIADAGYNNPTGSEFPIMAWITFWNDKEFSKKNYQMLRKAGFNISLSGQLSLENTLKTIDVAKGTGVKVMVNCSVMKNIDSIPKYVRFFENRETVMGYYITDEPKADSFDKWGEICRLIKSTDKQHLPFINLLPLMPAKVLGGVEYPEYLQDFLNVSDSPLLSFDNYAIIFQNDKPVVFESFYENLEMISKTARKNNVPFWSFCLSAPLGNYPNPTKEFLHFEAFSALAYGSQGISYFTYSIEPQNLIGARNAPLNIKGERTYLWNLVKNNNIEIQQLSHVFLGSEVCNVWHTGEALPRGTNRLTKMPYPFISIEAEKKGLLISLLRNQGKSYLMVVNHDIINSQKVSFISRLPLTHITYKKNERVGRDIELNIEAGGYAIFSW